MPSNPFHTINYDLLGEFKENNRHGKGTLQLRNGENYTGDWVHDKKAGEGVYIWVTGNQYQYKYSSTTYSHITHNSR